MPDRQRLHCDRSSHLPERRRLVAAACRASIDGRVRPSLIPGDAAGVDSSKKAHNAAGHDGSGGRGEALADTVQQFHQARQLRRRERGEHRAKSSQVGLERFVDDCVTL